MQVEEDLVWVCQYCSIHNTVDVDLTIRGKQDFVEDCRICCRPNRIIVLIDQEENISIEARYIDE